MNKILIGVVLLIVIGVSAGLYLSSDETNEGTSLYKSEVSEKVSGPKNLEPGNVVIDDKNNVLNLSGQNLTKAPVDIFSRVKLEELNLSNNKIEGSLQAEIRLLVNLQVLDLSNNNFTGVPAEVGQLAKLEVLNLANNKLTGLPMELGNLTSIKRIDLRGNAYAKSDLDSIKAKLGLGVEILVD